MTACFIGHEDVLEKEEIKKSLENLFNRMIVFGYDCFLFSGVGEFDDLAYEIGKKLKMSGAKIKLIFCYEQSEVEKISTDVLNFSKYDSWRILKYINKDNIKFKYDTHKKLYLKYCAMIEESDFAVFYVGRSGYSCEFKAFHSAVSKNKNYINLYQLSFGAI